MKKLFLSLSFLLVAGETTIFAKIDPGVNPRVEASFKKEFPGVQIVKWTVAKEYLKASFVLMDYRVEALFSNEGELLLTSRDLLYDQLPLAVMKELEKKFPGASATEIKEVNNSNGTKYKLLLETVKKKYRIVATPDGTVSITERIKK